MTLEQIDREATRLYMDYLYLTQNLSIDIVSVATPKWIMSRNVYDTLSNYNQYAGLEFMGLEIELDNEFDDMLRIILEID